MKRNAKGGKPSSWIRPEKRHAIYARDLELCAWCGGRVSPADATLDHLWPEGHVLRTNDPCDLTTAHWDCNNTRQAVDPLTYLERLAAGGFDVAGILTRLGRRVIPLDIEQGRALWAQYQTMRSTGRLRVVGDDDDIPF